MEYLHKLVEQIQWRIMVKTVFTSAYLLTVLANDACFSQGEVSEIKFQRLNYNNPGLTVDLGVGLWAWPIPVDYDSDGDLDLMVSCPDVPFNGVHFFENTTGESFPVFNPPVRIGPSIKNIQVSYVKGAPRYMLPGVEITDLTSGSEAPCVELFPMDTFNQLHKKIRFSQWKYVDYENDGDQDIVVGIQDGEDYGWDNAYNEKGEWTNGPLHGYVYLVENVRDKFVLKGQILGGGKPIDVYGAPSPNFGDFDNDGDLDIICGEFIDKFTWFENTGTRTAPVYAGGKYLENNDGIIKMDLEMIIPVAIDWDRDGDIDLIVGDEDGRVAFVENTGKSMGGMPLFESPRYFQQKAQYVKFGALATPFSTDWDDDGDEDLIIGNSAGYIGFIENLDGGNPPRWAKPVYLSAAGKVIRLQAGESGSIQGPCESKWGYTVLTVADWNNDGLKDIIANSIWGKVVWLENVGEKGAPQLAAEKPVLVRWEGTPPKPEWNWWNPEPHTLATQWRTTPFATDWNGDGHMDLVLLDHEGFLSYFERESAKIEAMLKPGKRIYYSSPGQYNRHNVPVDSAAGTLRINVDKYGSSGRRKMALADWDSDGDMDIILNGKNAVWYENTGAANGQIAMEYHGDLSDVKLAGHTTSPTTVDWDKNNIPDLLLGAEDGHFYYMPNPR